MLTLVHQAEVARRALGREICMVGIRSDAKSPSQVWLADEGACESYQVARSVGQDALHGFGRAEAADEDHRKRRMGTLDRGRPLSEVGLGRAVRQNPVYQEVLSGSNSVNIHVGTT